MLASLKTPSGRGVPLSVFERQDLEDFHGRALLTELYGAGEEHFEKVCRGRLAADDGIPSGARRRGQCYAVLGCKRAGRDAAKSGIGLVARKLLLRAGPLDIFSDRFRQRPNSCPHLSCWLSARAC